MRSCQFARVDEGIDPCRLIEKQSKKENCLKGEGGYILFCVSEFCVMRVESTPSKDVYVFFILRRRVQRYCTAVRGVKNKKHIHRRHKILCVQNKIHLPETVHHFLVILMIIHWIYNYVNNIIGIANGI